jgi:hypothetical protein
MGTCVPRQRAGRRRQPQVHTCVDLVLSLPSDRFLELVARCRQVQGPAEMDERSRRVERKRALESLPLDLGLLAQAFGLEQRREYEAQKEQDDPTACRCAEKAHQKRK